MPKIRLGDMRIIDEALGMGGGYVLDFSDRTFSQLLIWRAGPGLLIGISSSWSRAALPRSCPVGSTLIRRRLRSAWRRRLIGML